MTLMVRDEADIIAAMIEHHLAEGIDLIIATDNGSVDGTREILAAYAKLGVVELFDDFEHRKQQHSVVTSMARRAFTEHGATWVVNADADEFWVSADRETTLRDTFAAIPVEVASFLVPVHNMTGPPARSGSGLRRLLWKDMRTKADMSSAGIFAPPTANAVHVGDPSVTVAQGNHAVSLASQSEPGKDFGIEVLHYPWRSWSQFERKVENAGLGYEANPDLTPSPSHHGMRDYQRYRVGALLPFYLLRHAATDQLAEGEGQFVRDDGFVAHLEGLVDSAREPELLTRSLDDTGDDVYDDAQRSPFASFAQAVVRLENDRDDRLRALSADLAAQEAAQEAAALGAERRLADQVERTTAIEREYSDVLATSEYRYGVRLIQLARRLRLTSLPRIYRKLRSRRGRLGRRG